MGWWNKVYFRMMHLTLYVMKFQQFIFIAILRFLYRAKMFHIKPLNRIICSILKQPLTFLGEIDWLFLLDINRSDEFNMRHQYGAFFTMLIFVWMTKCQFVLKERFYKDNAYSGLICSDGFLERTNEIETAFYCAKLCALLSNCLSFFYNQNLTCQIHDSVLSYKISCTSLLGTSYYVRNGE